MFAARHRSYRVADCRAIYIVENMPWLEYQVNTVNSAFLDLTFNPGLFLIVACKLFNMILYEITASSFSASIFGLPISQLFSGASVRKHEILMFEFNLHFFTCKYVSANPAIILATLHAEFL